jgi:hypothetical protein
MSQAEFQLPDVGESVAVLDNLYAEAFFSKMAEYGYAPADIGEAENMLETAAYLDELPEESTHQKSAAADSPYTDANANLKEVLASAGMIDVRGEELVGIKQASYACAQNADLYKAVLAVKAAEAQDQSEAS